MLVRRHTLYNNRTTFLLLLLCFRLLMYFTLYAIVICKILNRSRRVYRNNKTRVTKHGYCSNIMLRYLIEIVTRGFENLERSTI